MKLEHRSLATAVVAAIVLWLAVLAGRAAEITISAAEFQRIVYSGHVLTEMANKPELDAVLQTLLEVHLRNPQADPAALAAVLQQALARFRTNAPPYLRAHEARDEILAVYLEALNQIPAHTNFNSATHSLLNILMGEPGRNPPTNTLTASQLLHAGNQGFINAEDTLGKRQGLVDTCTRHAQSNPSFRHAMDLVVIAESGVSSQDSAEHIITNSPAMSSNPAMLQLLALSRSNGGIQTTMANIDTLLTNELQILRNTIEANRQVHFNIIQEQGNLMAYLANANLVNALALYESEAKAPQADRIVASHASVNALSALMQTRDFTRSKQARAIGNAWASISAASSAWSLSSRFAAIDKWNTALKFGKVSKGLTIGGGLAGAAMALVSGFAFPSPEEIMLQEIDKVKQLIFQLGDNMQGRFDQVDGSLNNIQATLNQTLLTVNQIAYDVQQTRQGLLSVQLDLDRLEQQLFIAFNEQQRTDLRTAINAALYYENKHQGDAMSWQEYGVTPNYENTFYTYAGELANNGISSKSSFPVNDLADSQLKNQFEARPLNANLNYVKEALHQRLNQADFNPTSPALANPQDWFVSASAYLQLALENPLHFRKLGMQLNPIIARGTELTNFLRSLTFTGANINWPLYNLLTASYASKLASFSNRVHAAALTAAATNNFDLDLWHQWFLSAPRVTTTGTQMRSAPQPLPTMPRFYEDFANQISSGFFHHLALKTYPYATVVGWGDTNAGPIPSDLGYDVDQIAAGGFHGLARKADGTVRAWGWNGYGQTDIPPGAQSGVSRVAGGGFHSLALKNDGTVVGWGYNIHGQTNTTFLSGVVQIAAGWFHSLAVKADASVVGWGYNNDLETAVPAGLRARAVAAGGYHSLAVTTNYMVVGWGANWNGQTTIPPGLTNVAFVAAGGWHSLALRLDGTVIAWGYNDRGQTNVPPGLAGVVAIAAGYTDSLALKSDGTIVAWGDNTDRQSLVPSALTWRGRIAAGANNILALKSDGTLAGWGAGSSGLLAVPGITNVVAMAGGGSHSLALQSDGTVIAWGNNGNGQTNIPARATNIVAISAGDSFSLALKSDGTIVGWGDNSYGVANPANLANPSGLTNMVAIAAGRFHGLALKADGTVEGWGAGYFGAGGFLPPPHYGQAYVAGVNVIGNRIVQIAAGAYHSLALREDGTVFGWGLNLYGQTTGVPNNISPNDTKGIVMRFGRPLSNIVAIAAGENHSLALRADGYVIGWGAGQADYPYEGPHYGQTDIPAEAYGVVAIAAGGSLSAALRYDGTIIVWGQNDSRRIVAPEGMSDAVAIAAGGNHSLVLTPYLGGTVRGLGANTQRQANGDYSYASGYFVTLSGQLLANVVAIAAGGTHSLALQAGGAVYGWGENRYGQGNGYSPFTGPVYVAGQPLVNVVAIAAGRNHSLALKADGGVVGWGLTNSGQVNIPPGATNQVVAIAAGGDQSLALKADGTVVGWGYPQMNTAGLAGVVAIAAGAFQSLALKADGTVVGLGINTDGLSNVVAIAMGDDYGLALKADGTVAGLGGNSYDQINTDGLSNVVAIAAGSRHSLFLTAASVPSSPPMPFVLAQIPFRASTLLANANQRVITEIGSSGDVNVTGTELSGAKALIQAVLELGMSYTMERDDVLHGFFHGSEPLVDLSTAQTWLEAENQQLLAPTGTIPQDLTETAGLRHQLFSQRLNQSLLNLQTNGQPEIPRLVGHTLRLLNFLRDSWGATPPSSLEIGRATNGVGVVLYGEPYARYALRQSLSLTNWPGTTITTNLRSADSPIGIVATNLPITADPARFYRAAQPAP